MEKNRNDWPWRRDRPVRFSTIRMPCLSNQVCAGRSISCIESTFEQSTPNKAIPASQSLVTTSRATYGCDRYVFVPQWRSQPKFTSIARPARSFGNSRSVQPSCCPEPAWRASMTTPSSTRRFSSMEATSSAPSNRWRGASSFVPTELWNATSEISKEALPS